MWKLKKIRIPDLRTLPKTLAHLAGDIKKSSIEWTTFMVLFAVFLVNLCVVTLLRQQFVPPKQRMALLNVTRKLSQFVSTYDRASGVGMNRIELFELAFRNMVFKKSRTIITVGGMALGVSAIVFLVSLGYGLQKLVIDRVARLDELRQADIAVQAGSNVKLNDAIIEKFKSVSKVTDALPLVGVVAKVNFQGSESDVAVYGVTTEYLRQSAIKTVQGALFESKYRSYLLREEMATVLGSSVHSLTDKQVGTVAGANTQRDILQIGDTIQNVTFNIFPDTWLRVRADSSTDSKILGYTKKTDSSISGVEYLGEGYDLSDAGHFKKAQDGTWLGKWIKGTYKVWDASCAKESALNYREDEGDAKNKCAKDDYKEVVGYIAEIEILVYTPSSNGQVLAAEDTRETTESTSSAVSINDTLLENGAADDLLFLSTVLQTSNSATTTERKRVRLPESSQKEAVVNQALLKLLGMEKGDPLGKTFDVSFVVTSDLLENSQENIQSESAPYKIVGVVLGDETPFFYVPLNDLRGLDVKNFSQIKMVVETPDDLKKAREKVEALGFVTNSVADTVNQINSLFATLRIVLAIIGSVALGVASLGMFNTLTVSLLERTREVGLMKAMGMTSIEVKRLFLTESMLMGFLGGVLGILSGFIAGKLISVLISVFGLLNGVGFIDVSYLPPTFVTLVFGLSVFVGLVTGYYPSRRATKISALDALRYE